MRSDLSNRSSNYICTLLITHRFTNNTIFWCHSSFELYFYALEFLLNFFLHLIFGSFVHCHTHIVHICNYFPSIDVNKNHSIKQNKKKSIRISNVYRFWANAFSRVWILLDIVLSVCRRFSQFGSLPLFFWYKNKIFNSLYFHWYRFHGDLKMIFLTNLLSFWT